MTSNRRSSEWFANEIRSRWQGSVQGIFDTCNMLETSKAELSAAEFLEMWRDDLKWSRGMVSRLLRIVGDVRLLDIAHAQLPPSWYTLWALTRLTDEQFQRGLDEGIIHSGMQRKDIAQLRPPKPRPERPPEPKREPGKPVEQGRRPGLSPRDDCILTVRKQCWDTALELHPDELEKFFTDIGLIVSDLKKQAMEKLVHGHYAERKSA